MKTIINDVPEWEEFRKGRRTIEIGYPWLTTGAIINLERIIKPDFKILEFGCGGSTVFFSDRAAYIKSYDFNEQWANSVRIKANASLHEIVVTDMDKILGLASKEKNDSYDLVLVDIGASRKEFEIRRKLLDISILKTKTGGYLAVDNYMRRPLRGYDYKGFVVYTFDDIGHVGRGTIICQKLG